jgi:hypothetical protein
MKRLSQVRLELLRSNRSSWAATTIFFGNI